MPETLEGTLLPPTEQKVSHTAMMTHEQAAQMARDVSYLVVARELTIDCHDDAVMASNELVATKKRWGELDAERKSAVDPLNGVIAKINGWFRPALTARAEAETIIKGKLADWKRREDKRIADENAAAEAERKRIADEAEQVAAAERARAAEQAAEQQRIADKAERDRLAAIEAGDTKGAAKAAAAAAKATEKAAQVVENAETKASGVLMAAAAAAPAPLAAQKIAGQSSRTTFIAELAANVDEPQALQMIAAAIVAGRTDLVAYLKLDMSAATKTAAVQKKLFNVPGLVVKERTSVVQRAA